MIHLQNTEHALNLGQQLYQDNVYSDIILIAGNGTFYAHSHLIFKHIKSLEQLICDGCKLTHENIVIFIPDVRKDILEVSWMELYLQSDPTQLRNILNVRGVENNSDNRELLRNTDDVCIQEIKCEESSCNEIVLEDKIQEGEALDKDIHFENDVYGPCW